VSDLSAALSYLGLSDVVQVSGDTASFLDGLDAAWSGCSDQLANVAWYYAQVLAACAGTVVLVFGEVPSLGGDTLATLAAGAACAESLKQYIEACQALGQCLGTVDDSHAQQVSYSTQTIDGAFQQALAMADQAQGSADTATA
jgi:hypothetical protein